MQTDWLIEVLVDLEAYSRKKGLKGLEDKIRQTKLIAAAEISTKTITQGEIAPDRRRLH